ncbi:hypothetical protein MMC20_002523 [Loxospora ochrophaea]|nr:hypothetical protein [Loxospora ochrophaea]
MTKEASGTTQPKATVEKGKKPRTKTPPVVNGGYPGWASTGPHNSAHRRRARSIIDEADTVYPLGSGCRDCVRRERVCSIRSDRTRCASCTAQGVRASDCVFDVDPVWSEVVSEQAGAPISSQTAEGLQTPETRVSVIDHLASNTTLELPKPPEPHNKMPFPPSARTVTSQPKAGNIWKLGSYLPPRGPCNYKVSLISPACTCLRFMVHPAKAASSFECDGCGHHASFHQMENRAEDELVRRWRAEEQEQDNNQTEQQDREREESVEIEEPSAKRKRLAITNGDLEPSSPAATQRTPAGNNAAAVGAKASSSRPPQKPNNKGKDKA